MYIDICILMAIHIKYIVCFYLFPKYYYISLFVQLLNSDWFAFLLLGSFFRIYILVIILTSNNYIKEQYKLKSMYLLHSIVGMVY